MNGALILKFLSRYWLHIAGIALVAFTAWRGYAAVYERGARDERAIWLAKENKALTKAVADRDKAIADRNAAQRRADELAKLPPKVIEIVRTNPSGCVLPKPVADAARVHVNEVNEAIRAVR